MNAKQLRLAKWKQSKQAAEAAKAEKPAAAATAAAAAPEPVPASVTPASPRPLKLSLANLRRKRGTSRRVALGDDQPDDEGPSGRRGNVDEATKTAPVDYASASRESIDDVLNSLQTDNVAYSATYVSGDSSDASDEEVLAPRKKPKRATSKLGTVVADHATDSFEKVLFQPQSSSSTDADVFRIANGISLEGADVAPITNWHTAGLPLPLLQAIEARRYASPTPIQAQSLPIIMSGSDLVGTAPTSSGKTIAFLLPLCRHVAANRAQHRKMSRGPYALVLAPTRELCQQIFEEVDPLARSLQLSALGCYGGTDIASQISELINGRCDIIVATPGRLIDLLATNHGRVLSLRGVTFLVVDETDRMFDLGFGPQVRTIVGAIRPDRQTVVFSATMSTGMESLVSRILSSPAKVSVGHQATVPPQIAQEVLLIGDRQEKMAALLRLLAAVEKPGLSLVFVETQDKADAIALQLMAKGFKCQSLHGGMDQQDRVSTIAEFRKGTLPVLVATSIAARGLDVRGVKLVVNFDAASHLEDYVHRAGRTGRGGDTGKCVTFLEPHQMRQAHELSKLFSVPPDVQELATQYAQSSNKPASSRLGFGGHGLANLDKKRDFKKAVEHDAYAPKQESQEPETRIQDATPAGGAAPESAIVQEGTALAARLPINDLPREARIAVTAAGNQARVSSDFGVSITIRGTFHARPKKDITDEQKLHLYIEGETRDSVLGALNSLNELIDEASAKQGGRYMTL